MSKNWKICLVLASQTGQMSTWSFGNWGIGRHWHREYKSPIWYHEKWLGKFGERLKLVTWICRIGNNNRKVFFANGMALGKCVDRFVKVNKLAHLKYFQSRMHGYKPFDLGNHGFKVMTSWIVAQINLHFWLPVKLYKL